MLSTDIFMESDVWRWLWCCGVRVYSAVSRRAGRQGVSSPSMTFSARLLHVLPETQTQERLQKEQVATNDKLYRKSPAARSV